MNSADGKRQADALGPAAASPLAARHRLLHLGLAWGLYCAALPGALPLASLPLALSTGLRLALALVAFAVWARQASRPGPGAFRVEWLLAGLAACLMFSWLRFIFAPILLLLGLVLGFHLAVAGWALRRLTPRLSLPVAAAISWIGAEVLRAKAPTPLGQGWLQPGHLLVDWPLLAGAARVVGVEGLGAALVLAGAGLGCVFEARRRRAGLVALALAPLALFALSWSSRASLPPSYVPGPKILIVQPGFEQERKQFGDAFQMRRDLLESTRRALALPAAQGVQLVCWGETMLWPWVALEGLRAGIEKGAKNPPWRPALEPDEADYLDQIEAQQVALELYGRREGIPVPGRRALLPPGACFLSGVETLDAQGDSTVRRNSVLLWGPDGRRLGVAHKQALVPGAESMLGLERLSAVRALIESIAGYVPDFQAGEQTSVLELPGDPGLRFSATVCFDNAFPSLYAGSAAQADLHLIVSNEAWYRDSFEADQMLAFSKLIALATGRSVVRVTNSGISCALGPEGQELARLLVEGRDREVAGSLVVEPLIPASSALALPTTFWSRWSLFLEWGWIVALALALCLCPDSRYGP